MNRHQSDADPSSKDHPTIILYTSPIDRQMTDQIYPGIRLKLRHLSARNITSNGTKPANHHRKLAISLVTSAENDRIRLDGMVIPHPGEFMTELAGQFSFPVSETNLVFRPSLLPIGLQRFLLFLQDNNLI